MRTVLKGVGNKWFELYSGLTHGSQIAFLGGVNSVAAICASQATVKKSIKKAKPEAEPHEPTDAYAGGAALATTRSVFNSPKLVSKSALYRAGFSMAPACGAGVLAVWVCQKTGAKISNDQARKLLVMA